jgi:hypothetical protein
MVAKTKPCTLGPKHKWTHVRDVTFKSITQGPSGTRMTLSCRGGYKCECGATRYGQPKGGL